MANNGKRPRDEPARNFSAFRTCGPIRRQRLPSEEDPLSDLDYDYASSSDYCGWTSTESESMDTDVLYDEEEEEEMMLLYALEEEATEDEMDGVDFSTDEDSEYEEAMDQEIARVEMEMFRKQQRKKLIPPEMIPDGIDSDDEEAWQFLEDEWMCEQEQLVLLEQQQQQKNEATSKSAQDSDVPDWNALDAINRRFLLRGNVTGKPCTMTSSVGARRARISMVGTIVPATEMLRNYFRDARRSSGWVKENTARVPVQSKTTAVVAPRMMARSNGAACQRKALSERNL